MDKKIVDVAAGVILRPDGQLLLGQRPHGKPWSGWWELPGGKIEPGETVQQALARELHEEIGIVVTAATPWVTLVHAYPEKTVRLSFCKVTAWDGEPQGLESQALAWVAPADAASVGTLLPATLPVLKWLGLPDTYAITHIGHPAGLGAFLDRLDAALTRGITLIQFREPGWPEGPDAASLHDAFQIVAQRCRAAGARLVVNSVHPLRWAQACDGLHLRAADAALFAARGESVRGGAASDATPHTPTGPDATDEITHLSGAPLLGVSAHTPQDIATARALNADFVVVGPVLPTPSHPESPGIGWRGFERVIEDAGLPAYALGGQSPLTLNIAHAAGAQGVAGIRSFI